MTPYTLRLICHLYFLLNEISYFSSKEYIQIVSSYEMEGSRNALVNINL